MPSLTGEVWEEQLDRVDLGRLPSGNKWPSFYNIYVKQRFLKIARKQL